MNRISSPFKSLIISSITVSFLFLSSHSVSGKNYYFSASGGNDTRTSTQAQSSATPWKTITKLNSFFSSLLPGDSVLFKRGETFYGAIIGAKSGTLSLPIVVGAFGTGNNPVITGFTTISGWISMGGGIYSKVISSASAPTMVLINGVQFAMGRYPNTGWLYYETHSGTTLITDNQLPATPSWTGAEAVIKKNNWTVDRNPITNHTAQTLTITNTGALTDTWGYYIQNSLSTLDQLGEWYYNPATSTFYMYFGTVDPTTKTVQVSTVDNVISLSSGYNYLNINNLTFIGGNKLGISIKTNNFININNCNVDFSGNVGIYIYFSNNCTVENSMVNHSNDRGIYSGSTSNNTTIRNCIIKNTEPIFGQGISNYMSGVGIFAFQGDNILLEKNVIDSTSYCAIKMGGNNQIVKNNLLDHFGLTKTDGGGIYYGSQALYSNMIIDGNIILNGTGGVDGKPLGSVIGGVRGIYIDAYSTGPFTIRNNSISTCLAFGIFIHASNHISVTGNTVFNCKAAALGLQETDGIPTLINTLTVNNNIFVAKEVSQLTLWARLNPGSTFAGIGTFNNNYYARPISDATTFKAFVTLWDGTAFSLSAWKTTSGQDANSLGSPKVITSTSDLRFEYNATNTSKVIPLDASYISVTGATFNGSITLAPYTSAVLIKSGTSSLNNVPVIQNQGFKVDENSLNGTVAGTVVASDPDAGQILTYSIVSGNTNGAFSINSSTGVLTVAATSALNFETTPTFTLLLKVQDNGTNILSSQATITVSLNNINEAPVISSQSFSVINNTANGAIVGTVVASDPDAGQTLTYSIVSGNTGGAFSINSLSGLITVANSDAFLGTDYSLLQSFAPLSSATNILGNGTAPYELGMKFSSNTNGFITGLRFYKGVGASGTHIGNLWSVNGVNLASATFTNETASGWQTVTLSTPVAITANTIYIVSYFSQHGDFMISRNYFTTDIVTGPLLAPASTANQGNGVYIPTSTSTFPTNTNLQSNYWADVIFSSTLQPPSSFDLVVKVQDNGMGNLSSQAKGVITLSGANLAPSIINQSFSVADNSAYGTSVGTVVASDPDTGQTLSFSLISGNTGGAFAINSATGAITVANSDGLSGTDYSLLQSTAPINTAINILGNGTATYEVGMKFSSNINGYITGLRFYKGVGASGTHIGNLWSIGGVNLASATFTSETASGWQTVTLSTPVAIIANAIYIVSYFSQHGDFIMSRNYFTANVVNGPLTALASTATQGNGVYLLTTSSAFPTKTNLQSNYWADVIFTSTLPPPPSFSLVVKVQDNGAGNLSNQATITVNLNAVKSVRVLNIISIPTDSVSVGVPYSYTIFTSAGNESLVGFSAKNLPSWLSFSDNENGTGILQGIPINEDIGFYHIILEGKDNIHSTQQTFTIEVKPNALQKEFPIHKALGINVYPNPVTDGMLNIKFEELVPEQFELLLFEISGKLVLKKEFENVDLLTLDLSPFSSGLYLIKINSLNFHFLEKFIIR